MISAKNRLQKNLWRFKSRLVGFEFSAKIHVGFCLVQVVFLLSFHTWLSCLKHLATLSGLTLTMRPQIKSWTVESLRFVGVEVGLESKDIGEVERKSRCERNTRKK